MDLEHTKYAPRLILATNCQRRADLLRSVGIAFIQADQPTRFDDEEPVELHPLDWGPRDKSVHEYAERIALQKARRLARHGHWRIEQGAHTIILAAKTIAFGHRDQPLTIPEDRDQAHRMIEKLVQHGQRVVTACAYLQPDSRLNETLADTADVRCDMDDDAIQAYLDTEAWRDRIGACDRLNPPDTLPLHIKGDRSCLEGMPLEALARTFENWSLIRAGNE